MQKYQCNKAGIFKVYTNNCVQTQFTKTIRSIRIPKDRDYKQLKTMNKLWNLTFLCIGMSMLVILQACEKTATITPTNTPTPSVGQFTNVASPLWVYFQRFEEEALTRGLEVNLNAFNLTAEIRELDGEGVAGQCSYNHVDPNHIIINKEFWEVASDLLKEMVIFHELGHCYLYRDHREGTDNIGRCISIMRSGLGTCRDGYNASTRSAYLDELFDINLINN